ncbi:hypothetical protein PILCRDRAFT_480220 [Piloderma croceum F 1598]|uniref:Uncharacterized protein n=1 Tax=Piloderma croceum (strain F 1598) TaxID=765440 RepID=A0A0C3BX22_PILCF|nr:hypothetical protein PILCRDRAFT_480220 [Piloderma croceum F 1598]
MFILTSSRVPLQPWSGIPSLSPTRVFNQGSFQIMVPMSYRNKGEWERTLLLVQVLTALVQIQVMTTMSHLRKMMKTATTTKKKNCWTWMKCMIQFIQTMISLRVLNVLKCYDYGFAQYVLRESLFTS